MRSLIRSCNVSTLWPSGIEGVEQRRLEPHRDDIGDDDDDLKDEDASNTEADVKAWRVERDARLHERLHQNRQSMRGND
jgi:hypothetical protein